MYALYAETFVAELLKDGIVLGVEADEEVLTPRTLDWGACSCLSLAILFC